MAVQNNFVSLFGSDIQLLKNKTEHISLTELSNSVDYVALYFSAHWCPPCRNFTPNLGKFYEEHHKDKKFQIIFVSSDKDESSFAEYFGEMPWTALPFKERAVKDKLAKLYKISGIPSLVILDKQAEIVNANARSKVSADPKAEEFPWKPKTIADIMTGTVIDHSGKEITIDSLKTKSAIGVYFSAHWCPPCKGFTPKLVETYNKIKAAGKGFEIIFASSDNSDAEFKEYFETMPWLSFPLNDKRKDELSDLLKIEGIPSLVIFDSNFKIINDDGRLAVESDPQGEDFPWYPKPLNSVESSSKINEMPCFIYLDTNLNDEFKKKLQSLAEHFTNSWKDKPEAPLCFLYGSTGDLAQRIRSVANVKQDPGIVILDVQEGCKYLYSATEFSEDGMKTFVQDFEAGKLKSVGLRE